MDGPLAYLLDGLLLRDALHVLIGTELQVDGIGVLDEGLGRVIADELGQIAAHLGGEGQLAVGKGPGPGEARGDVAGLAAHAAACLGFGAAALLHGPAFLHQQDALAAPLAQQLHGGENAGGPGADDENVCVHGISTLPGARPLFFVVCAKKPPRPAIRPHCAARYSRPQGGR